MTISLFLAVLGLVLILLAGLNVPGHPRFNYGWMGLFFWFVASLVKL